MPARERLGVGDIYSLTCDAALGLIFLGGLRAGRPNLAFLGATYFALAALCIVTQRRRIACWLHGILAAFFLGLALVGGYVLFQGMFLERGDSDILRPASVVTPILFVCGTLFAASVWLLRRADASE